MASGPLVAPQMDKFRLVERPREDSPKDEIRVTNAGRTAVYVAYAAKLLREEQMDTITIRGSGSAIPVAIATVEILKRRIEGLHQQSKVGNAKLVDEYEPLEAGLERQTRTRFVPFLQVILSRLESAVDKNAPGYQAPLDPSEIEEFKDVRPTTEGRARRPARRGGGYGEQETVRGRGRGQQRRSYRRNEVVDGGSPPPIPGVH